MQLAAFFVITVISAFGFALFVRPARSERPVEGAMWCIVAGALNGVLWIEFSHWLGSR